jgi:tetratricopeptide (TPR) repeat protein
LSPGALSVVNDGVELGGKNNPRSQKSKGEQTRATVDFPLASFRPPRHITWQFSSAQVPERIPAMSTRSVPLNAVVLAAVFFGSFADASEPGHSPKLQISIIPRKAASARDRASEVVQKTPEFSIWDAKNKVTPSGAGHVFIVEQVDGDRLLVMDMNEGLRGWISSGSVLALDDAEKFFTQQIQLHRNEAFAYLMRGVARYETDDLDHAVLDLDAALRLDPKYVPALIERAYLWQWRNQLDQALADVSKAIELDPRNSYALVERGVFEYNKKEYDKAQRDFQSAIELGSRTAVIYIARGMIFLNKHDPSKAYSEFKLALEIDARHPDVYAAIASMYLMQGKTDKAKKVLDQAVEIDPLCADSHGNRAVVLLSMGQYDEAIDDLDDVVKVAPNSIRALRERAWILATCPDAKVRNGELAVSSATRACELTDWKDAQSLSTLAAAHSESGHFEEAVKWQQKAIELLADKSPDKHEYRKVLDRYTANKPYHRLSLLEEMGVPIPRPAARKVD